MVSIETELEHSMCKDIYGSLLKDQVKNIFMFQNKKTLTIIHQCPNATSSSMKCKCRFYEKYRPPIEYADKHKKNNKNRLVAINNTSMFSEMLTALSKNHHDNSVPGRIKKIVNIRVKGEYLKTFIEYL